MLAVALPVGAIVTGFVMVAVPILLLAGVWAVVTSMRILFPERPLPFDPVVRRQRAASRGESVPVRLRDILEDEALRQTAAAGDEPPPAPRPHPFVEDLWLRRN